MPTPPLGHINSTRAKNTPYSMLLMALKEVVEVSLAESRLTSFKRSLCKNSDNPAAPTSTQKHMMRNEVRIQMSGSGLTHPGPTLRLAGPVMVSFSLATWDST